MPMSETFYNLLKEKLGDVKIKVDDKDVTLVSVVEGWHEKSEAAIKIQEANKELADKKRDLSAAVKAKEDEAQALKTEHEKTKKELDKAMQGALTDKEREQFLRIKDKGMTEEAEVALNTARAELEQLRTQVVTLTTERNTLSETVSHVSLNVATESLKTRTMAKLAEFGIVGKKAVLAFRDLLDTGNLQVVKAADGSSFVEQFRKKTPEGKPIESNFETIVKEYATSDENAYLRNGSARGGTGDTHTTARSSTTQDDNRPSGLDMLKSDKKGFDSP